MNRMLRIIDDLTPLNRVFCSPDYDRAIDYLCQELPFTVHEYPAREEHNGWVIPPNWQPIRAHISQNRKVLWDGMAHPLRVIALSAPFTGRVGLDELKQHLHFDKRFADAVPYHFRQLYRPWARDWGFCVTKDFYDSLEPGEYDVVIETEESPGALKVLEYHKQGRLNDTFVMVAHLDHPGMANDDLAGCAVGVELFDRLSKQETKYSYKLLLVQELINSEYYLAHLSSGHRERLLEGLFLEMLGTATPLALQVSRKGESNLERAMELSLSRQDIHFTKGSYRSVAANDEIVFEAYGVPMASLSRYPYPQYHCDRDNASIMSEAALEVTVNVIWDALMCLEEDTLVRKSFSGIICLSNPAYNLYVDTGQLAFERCASDISAKMRQLMEGLTTLEHPETVGGLAARYGLDQSLVFEYLDRWRQRGLLAFD
jgi:aminopeptidase-like protein